MKVLVIGSGGREAAIIDSILKSNKKPEVFVAPGNAGMMEQATLVAIPDTDVTSLLDFALSNKIDLTIVGPESSLACGIVDLFEANNLRIFGPTKQAANIESSKQFAKDLMKKHGIPTASYQTFSEFNSALNYCENQTFPLVIKYDGLAQGKGVVIVNNINEASSTLIEMLVNDVYGKSNVVIEEFLTGPEFSFMCFVSGNKVMKMDIAQDHKRAFENDLGPNTGGMGAYSPVDFISKEDIDFAYEEIMKKVATALVLNKTPFKGVLYGGLMKTPFGIKVIEFNARFGDPETEVVLPRLKTDILDIFNAVIDGEEIDVEFNLAKTVGIVLASKGYPGSYDKGYLIDNLAEVDCQVYHMGTKFDNGKYYTNGGRVIIIVGKGNTIAEAKKQALFNIKKIKCDNLFYRKDIAYQCE